MNLRTVVHDCLYLNWALPVATLPSAPEPLRYQVHSASGIDYVFASALLFHHDSIRLNLIPLLRWGHPQMNLRLYVLDGEGCPAVLFQRLLMPPWMAPGVRWFTHQPAASALLQFPRPSRQPAAESWSWRAQRGEALTVRAWLDSPLVGQGPRLGSWEETVRYFAERPRGYGLGGGILRRVDATHRLGPVWPVRAAIDREALLPQLLPLAGAGSGRAWPPLHSAWINPEMQLSFSVHATEPTPVVHAVPHPAAGRVATVVRRDALETWRGSNPRGEARRASR